MLSYFQSAFLIVTALVISITVMEILNRAWPIKSRKLINDVTGWQLGVLGTTYGVILGFMLAAVWGDFHAADVEVYQEASSIVAVSRIAVGLPQPQGAELQRLAQEYADAAVNVEWPAMQRQEDVYPTEDLLRQMWQTLNSIPGDDPRSEMSRNHMTQVLRDLNERRTLREQEYAVRLPGLLWVLLIAGAGATVGSACVLGNDNRWLHYCQVLSLTLVVTLALAAIADLARPFEGAAAVRAVPFARAAVLVERTESR